MNSRFLLAFSALAVALFVSVHASAQYVLSEYGGVVWRQTYTLAAGETIQLQTEGCSGSEDTVIALLEGTGGSRITRGWSDDQGSGFTEPFCSYIIYTNNTGSAKTYEAVASIYPGTTVATVDIASWRSSTGWITELADVNLRGVTGRVWPSGTVTHETMGRVPNAGGGYADTVLYLIDTNVGATSAFDDDSGLGPLSRLTANLPCSSATLNCWIVAGLYGNFPSPISKFEVWGRTGADSDGDGVQDAIETVRGTRTDLADTDGDGISDYEEMGGVPAASLAGFDSSVIMPWEDTGANPTEQDVFMEIDYMTAASHDHNPSLASNWPNQLSDMQQIFTFDSSFTGRTIWPHVQISSSMPETTYLSLGNCSGADTTKFYDRKNDLFYFNPLKASIFHYAIWGHLLKDASCAIKSAIGQGEVWGNDLITALGGSSNQVGTTTLQRVNYIHEFGHNLALTHNGNGNPGNTNSCINASVMNYRYSGSGWTTTLRGSGYSNGTCAAVTGCANTCAANKCVPATQTTVKAGCSANNGTCDCDKADWSLLNLDIPSSAQMSFSSCQISNCNNGNGNRAAEADEARAFFLNGGALKAGHRQAAERRGALLEQRGIRQNVDFRLHPENGRAYSVE